MHTCSLSSPTLSGFSLWSVTEETAGKPDHVDTRTHTIIHFLLLIDSHSRQIFEEHLLGPSTKSCDGQLFFLQVI